jgi:hypothetical protein
MAVLTWGKPLVEIVASDEGAIPAIPTWIPVATIVEKSAKLTSAKGEVKTAKDEGGQLVDMKTLPNNYTFECEIYVQTGTSKPVTDVDGVVATRYCLRLTPEDDTLAGFIMEDTVVSCEETWDSTIGAKVKYTFSGVIPAVGAILKTYTKAGA